MRADQPITRGQRSFALAVVAVSAVLFVAAVPFAKTPLAPVAAFIPAYQSALVANDLVTAALLFGLFGHRRSLSLAILASGYFFTAVIAVVHALTFPGMVAPAGLLGAGPQTTAWLYMFWHGAFPLFVIAYALARNRPSDARWRRIVPTIGVASASVLLLVAALTLLATSGKDALPPIMSGNRYTPQMIIVVSSVWLASMAALATLWIRRPHSVIDTWLMVVMCAWIFDIALSAVLNGGRFDLGFYAGRIYGLVAASLVLIVLIAENARMHLRLARAGETMEAEQRRLVAANAALEDARLAALGAERAKGAFLATMSHEIRTPMNGILGMLELLSLMKLDGEQRTTLEIVRASGKSLLRIIDDILDFSKIEAGKLELRAEPSSVAALVERVRDIYSGNASSKGLDFEHRVDGRISPSLVVDPLRLQQILNNLVSNAIKFTDSGSVSLLAQHVRRDGDTEVVRFIVEDTGPGISEADRARLFEPFAQAGTRNAGGTGLGLSICRSLAQLMGGALEMASTPGEGTSVTLTLPLKIAALETAVVAPTTGEAGEEVPGRNAPTSAAARMKGVLVLVVDDHPVNRMLLVKQLDRLGYAAEAASHGVEALERLSLGGIGAVITDCNMPEMDGYELTRRIRAGESRSGRRRVPIIACTANALGGEAANCFAAGMDDYLAKPVLLAQLREKLERWLPHDEPAPAPLPDGAPIERSALAEITGGNPEVEREMLAQFVRYGQEDAQSLRIAIASRDMETAVRSAHRMKGAASAIGAHHLAAASARIEASGKAHDWTAMLAGMEEFEDRMDGLEAHLAAGQA